MPYLVFLFEGFITGFQNNFAAFGPTQDKNGEHAKFMGISLSTWTHVSIAYAIIFISTILQTYYNLIAYKNISMYVMNPAANFVPYSKLLSHLILTLNPIINIILYVINFFATATFQIQFILPQLLGSYIVNLPFVIGWLNKKTYIV